MSLDDILSLLVNGITLGAIYAMVGVSLNIAYKPTNVFNLAQGGFVMLGMMFAWGALTVWGLPWFIGTLLVMVAVALVGLVEERVAVAPLQNSPAGGHGWIVTTLAFSIVLVNIGDRVWGSDPRSVPPFPGTTLDTRELGPISFTTNQILVCVICISSIAAIELFYHRTRQGRAVLAVAEDHDGARLCGISPLRLTMGSFAASAAYAAFTGTISAPFLLASTSVGLEMLIKGFMALAIGGVGSNWGALLGGIIIACIESISSIYLSPGYRQVALLLVLLGILVLRPFGLFGRSSGREV
jgi:branched-chain amino acid transport system permease protein